MGKFLEHDGWGEKPSIAMITIDTLRRQQGNACFLLVRLELSVMQWARWTRSLGYWTSVFHQYHLTARVGERQMLHLQAARRPTLAPPQERTEGFRGIWLWIPAFHSH